MSTLRVSNIQDTAGSNNSTPAAIASGIAKAWVSFNGTGTTGTNQTIRSSYNVSSVLKNSTGDYTVNFTNALADANYSGVVGGGGFNNVGSHDGISVAELGVGGTRSTTQYRIRAKVLGQSPTPDVDFVNLAIFR